MTEHIVAIFDTEAAAEAAARDLEAAGIPASAVRRYRPNAEDGMAADGAASSTTSSSTGGFWAWLLGEEPAPKPDIPTTRVTKNGMYRARAPATRFSA